MAKKLPKRKKLVTGEEQSLDEVISNITKRIDEKLLEAFPILSKEKWKSTLNKIPGAGVAKLATKLAKRSTESDPKKRQKKQHEAFTTLEGILDELTKIRQLMSGEKPTGRGKNKGVAEALTPPSVTKIRGPKSFQKAAGWFAKKSESLTSLSGVKYEETARGAKYRDPKTGRYTKPGLVARTENFAGRAIGAIGRGVGAAGEGIGAAGQAVSRAGTSVVGAAVGAAGWLAALAAILPFFLPTDIKGMIGDIFEGILKGIGIDEDMVQAILTPFKVLSELADMIKGLLQTVWDAGKAVFDGIVGIVKWISGKDTEKPVPPKVEPTPDKKPEPIDRTKPALVEKPKESQDNKQVEDTREEKKKIYSDVVARRQDLEKMIGDPKTTIPKATDAQIKVIQQNIDVLRKRESQLLRDTITVHPPTEEDIRGHKIIVDQTKESFTTINKNVSVVRGTKQPPVPPPVGKSATGGALVGGKAESPKPEVTDLSSRPPVGSRVPTAPVSGQELDRKSRDVEAARYASNDTVMQTAVNNSTNMAGNTSEATIGVPAVDAPRADIDDDIYFSAIA